MSKKTFRKLTREVKEPIKEDADYVRGAQQTITCPEIELFMSGLMQKFLQKLPKLIPSTNT